jgi:hypothetical protein
MTTNTTMLAINLAEILLGCVERRRAGPIGDLNANHTQSRREFAVLLRLGLGFLVGTALGAGHSTGRKHGGVVHAPLAGPSHCAIIGGNPQQRN